jgi:diacylglycerol kinase (ATP)
MSFFSSRLKSFVYAFAGVGDLIRTQPNAWIHLAVTVLVIVAGVVLRLSTTEWALISLCIGLVLAAEAMNTAVELLCDKVSPERDPTIGRVKDLAAGSVLLAAIAAAACGLWVMLPKVIALVMMRN